MAAVITLVHGGGGAVADAVMLARATQRIIREDLGWPFGEDLAGMTCLNRSVQRQVFGPVGVTDARCAPVRDALLVYPPPFSGTAPGIPVPVGPSGCSGGGWFMTPARMLRVLDGLVSGRLLSASQRQLMDANCLGWDCSIAGQAGYRGK